MSCKGEFLQEWLRLKLLYLHCAISCFCTLNFVRKVFWGKLHVLKHLTFANDFLTTCFSFPVLNKSMSLPFDIYEEYTSRKIEQGELRCLLIFYTLLNKSFKIIVSMHTIEQNIYLTSQYVFFPANLFMATTFYWLLQRQISLFCILIISMYSSHLNYYSEGKNN